MEGDTAISYVDPSYARMQKLTLVNMAAVNFCDAVLFSIMAPFFPTEAADRGVSTTLVGIIFGEFPLIMFILSPFVGNYLHLIGTKFAYTAGMFLTAGSSILFGFLEYTPAGMPYIITCFLLRGVQAIGGSLFVTASYSIITNTYPNKVATMIGTLEAFNGFGMMMGPVIGAALYQFGGFKLPFFVLGGLLLIIDAVTYFILPPQSCVRKDSDKSMWQLLKVGPIWLVLIPLVIIGAGLAFLEPVLEPFVKNNFKLTPLLIGLIFVIAPALYAITAPLWGFLSDKKDRPIEVQLIGFLIVAIGYAVLGPAPFFNIDPTMWITIIGLVLIGLGVGACLVPPAALLLKVANKWGYEDNENTNALVSGLLNSGLSMGAFGGPMAAGALMTSFNFNGATMILGILLLANLPVLIILWILLKRSSNNESAMGVQNSDEADERTPILADC